MPELPEVEAARRLTQRECVGKKISQVIATPDEKVFQNLTPNQIHDGLINRHVTAAQRRGKHLFLEFDDSGPALLFHFGMTGGMAVRGRGGAHYQRYSVDDSSWPPKFCKLQLEFHDGTQLAFADSRRFARVRLQTDPLQHPPLCDLGWDPLLNMPSEADFLSALLSERRAIKALLLDQSFSAGVGNWVADEVLYQARIHPEQPACSLSVDKMKALHHWIPEVCRVASEVDADADRLPEDWLFHHRWGKGNATKNKIGGHTIDHITVGGRTSAYVAALQKLDKAAAAAAKPTSKPRSKLTKPDVGDQTSKKARKQQTTTVTKSKQTTNATELAVQDEEPQAAAPAKITAATRKQQRTPVVTAAAATKKSKRVMKTKTAAKPRNQTTRTVSSSARGVLKRLKS